MSSVRRSVAKKEGGGIVGDHGHKPVKSASTALLFGFLNRKLSYVSSRGTTAQQSWAEDGLKHSKQTKQDLYQWVDNISEYHCKSRSCLILNTKPNNNHEAPEKYFSHLISTPFVDESLLKGNDLIEIEKVGIDVILNEICYRFDWLVGEIEEEMEHQIDHEFREFLLKCVQEFDDHIPEATRISSILKIWTCLPPTKKQSVVTSPKVTPAKPANIRSNVSFAKILQEEPKKITEVKIEQEEPKKMMIYEEPSTSEPSTVVPTEESETRVVEDTEIKIDDSGSSDESDESSTKTEPEIAKKRPVPDDSSSSSEESPRKRVCSQLVKVTVMTPDGLKEVIMTKEMFDNIPSMN